jgi:hexulose-6-phosphate isomerase
MAPLERIGFMQGRLSAMVDGKIQAFPWNEWREEFPRANALGLGRIEWTIDQERLRENPLTIETAHKEILDLSHQNAIRIPSLTGDCFMQAPFWKAAGDAQNVLLADLDLVLGSADALGIELVVIPLVDNGKIESTGQAETLLRILTDRSASLSNPTCHPSSSRSLSTSSLAKPSASTTTSETAPHSDMIAATRFPPTGRVFSTCT